MNTEVSFDTESVEAIRNVRSDSCDDKYVICGHVDGKPNHIGLVCTGNDTTEIAQKMDPAERLYILARYELINDMSNTVKFVYFIWSGENLPFSKRGRYGVVLGHIEKSFEPYHISVTTSSTEDADNESVMQKLKDQIGTNSKVLEDNTGSGGKQYQMRGFTQTQLPQRQAKASFGISAVPTKGANVTVTQDVYDAVAKVRSDDESETWMVAGYDNGNPAGPIVCMGSGSSSGLQELRECMDDKIPMYGYYRVSHTDADDVSTVKFVFITWLGSKVKPMAKAKISTHKGLVGEIFIPAHVHRFATEMSEIDEEEIMRQIKKETGL